MLSKLKNDWSSIESAERDIDERLTATQKEKASLNQEKDSLGLFAGKRKRELKEKIGILEENLQTLLQKKEMLQMEKKEYASLSDVEKELDNLEKQMNLQKKMLEELALSKQSQAIRKDLSAFEYGKKLLKRYDHLHMNGKGETT